MGAVGQLKFSLDGTQILSTCGQNCKDTQTLWDTKSGKQVLAYDKHDNIVVAAAMGPDGDLVATAGGNNYGIHIWDRRTGETKRLLAGTGAPGWAAAFSKDGKRIGWGRESVRGNPVQGYGPIQFALTLPAAEVPLGLPQKVSAEEAASDFTRARTTFGPYELAHRKGGAFGLDALLDIKNAGRTDATIERAASNGFTHLTYTFTPDGQTIISGGSNGIITAYDLNGKIIGGLSTCTH